MEAVGGDPSAGQAARQLDREENIRQLGLAIARKPEATPRARGVQVVERDSGTLVRIR